MKYTFLGLALFASTVTAGGYKQCPTVITRTCPAPPVVNCPAPPVVNCPAPELFVSWVYSPDEVSPWAFESARVPVAGDYLRRTPEICYEVDSVTLKDASEVTRLIAGHPFACPFSYHETRVSP